MPDHCKPYQNDARKQSRFEAFLVSEMAYRRLAASQGGGAPGGAVGLSGSATGAEAAVELVEFAKVAGFFSQRAHSVISNRFTSSEVQGPGLGAEARPGGLSRPTSHLTHVLALARALRSRAPPAK